MSAIFAGTARSPRGTLPNRLIVAALAISLALNICVIAGALWNRANTPPVQTAAERFHRLEAALDLNDQQRAAFETYVAAARTRGAQLRKDIDPILDAAWAELGKEQPDEALVLQRFNDASTRWRASQRETVDATLALLATLSPEQRAKFIADERERRAAQRRRHAEESR